VSPASPSESGAPVDAPCPVAVAGATGFVGRDLVPMLAERHRVVALGRGVAEEPDPRDDPAEPGVTWRRCDLFSLYETERALAGVEVAYYLVHSMLPSSRLTQGGFQDLDLLLADNFGRAAASAGVRRIVYLGGLVPEDAEDLSPHLASRLEVEGALGDYGVPVTALRAGLVVGSRGSSLDILVRLVGRLPVMVCPSWTGSLSQPIALDDVVWLLARCLDVPETTGRVCEVGGPDVLSYRDMMRETARVMGKRRWMLPVPLFTPELSRLWVSLVAQSPKALVAPLIQSLRHPMVAGDRWLQERLDRPGRPFADAMAEALRTEALARRPTARSVQRLPLPAGRDAGWLAGEYAAWLPGALRGLVGVARTGSGLDFTVQGGSRSLLELTFRPDRSDATRALFEVTGGLLADPSDGFPRLEFRTVAGGAHALAAVHEFRPRLPWWLYAHSQAYAHQWVMWRFARHLARVAQGAVPASAETTPRSLA